MIEPLVTLAVSGLLITAALWVISRLVPDEYDLAAPARIRPTLNRATED